LIINKDLDLSNTDNYNISSELIDVSEQMRRLDQKISFYQDGNDVNQTKITSDKGLTYNLDFG